MGLLVPKIIVAVLVVAATISRWALLERRAKQTDMEGMRPEPPSRRVQILAVVVLVVAGVVLVAIR